MSAGKLASNLRHRYYPDSLIRLKFDEPPTTPPRIDYTLPKFHHSRSDSRLPKSQSKPRGKELRSISEKLYRKLDSRLKEIQDSISELQARRKKKTVPRKRAITQISQNGQSLKLQQQILQKIAEMKATAGKLPTEKPKPASPPQPRGMETERILFYGADYIDGVEFKIKIKVQKGQYYLYGKNAHAKLMMEMSEKEYKELHRGLLRQNPCNMLRYLSIENNQLRLRLKGSNHRAPSSLRCYLGYY